MQYRVVSVKGEGDCESIFVYAAEREDALKLVPSLFASLPVTLGEVQGMSLDNCGNHSVYTSPYRFGSRRSHVPPYILSVTRVDYLATLTTDHCFLTCYERLRHGSCALRPGAWRGRLRGYAILGPYIIHFQCVQPTAKPCQ